jgi:hypothetical protein
MRSHPDEIRYALMGCFLHVRGMEVSDEVTHMAIELIHRLDVRSEKQIHREWLADLERVDAKMQILSTIAEAVTEYPDGIVREVIFPRVKEEIFRNLVAEFRVTGPNLRLLRQAVMQRKFARHYRRMLPALLETLQFRSDNRFQPTIEALTVIERHLGSHYRHFPEAKSILIEGVVTPAWEERVFEEVGGERKVNRHNHDIKFRLPLFRPHSSERIDSTLPATRTRDWLLQCRSGRKAAHTQVSSLDKLLQAVGLKKAA